MEREPKQTWRDSIRHVVAVASAFSVLMTGGLLLVQNWEEAVPTSAVQERTDEGRAVQTMAGAGSMVIPMGRAVGIKLFSDGVLVVGLSQIETATGAHSPGRECGLKEGDIITHVNGVEVDTIEEVQQAVARQDSGPLAIQAVRGTHKVELTAKPVENEKGQRQLGVWLRDSMAGIGTMTFYDPESGVFGALGHGINDVDTSILMPIESGAIMSAEVSDVKKGVSGEPGELHGQFNMTEDMGQLYANTKMGIFGTMSPEQLNTVGKPMPVAAGKEVHTGEATILSNIRGHEVEEFAVRITRVSGDTDGTRNLMVEVTDPRLLDSTGGIVQGMSGSPIIQDGKLVGAVTHVLVNDPTRGYGIFIENMLNAAV